MKNSMNKRIIAIVAIIALVAILGVCLVACNKDSFVNRLEKAGYTVESLTSDNLGGYKVDWAIYAEKEDENVTIIKFKSADDGKKFYEQMRGHVSGGTLQKVNSKLIMFGTKQGVKDAQ